MPRVKLTIEYDGRPFVGWQRQANGRAVQQAIEEAFHAFTGQTVTVNGAGRTDTGVHALGQVAHTDLERSFTPDRIRDALNAHLRPEPVAILLVEDVPAGFDARFSAVGRRYLYRILCRRAPAALDAGRVFHCRSALDSVAMAEAAAMLLGTHDFTTFRAAACQAKSPLRTLDRLDVEAVGDEVHVHAGARSFLHSQVRSMVGSLVMVGNGKWPPSRVGEALAARNRAACGPLAPADGLYLAAVDY